MGSEAVQTVKATNSVPKKIAHTRLIVSERFRIGHSLHGERNISTDHLQRDSTDLLHFFRGIFAFKLPSDLKPVDARLIQLAAEFAGVDGEPEIEGLGDVNGAGAPVTITSV